MTWRYSILPTSPLGNTNSGKKIKNYIFQREAEFKGGQKAWAAYVSKKATKNLTAKGTQSVTAAATVEFIVSKDGSVIDAKITRSSGYKNVDRDALDIIANSPAWKPAIFYNEPVNAYRVQPVVYMLRPEGK